MMTGSHLSSSEAVATGARQAAASVVVALEAAASVAEVPAEDGKS